VCFIGYRDHTDKKRFAIKNFTEDVEEIKKWINGVKAEGGGDIPEDVTGGMKKCLEQYWKKNSTKQVFHILDAPCHGT
jgi:isopentenyl phosphate kinase